MRRARRCARRLTRTKRAACRERGERHVPRTVARSPTGACVHGRDGYDPAHGRLRPDDPDPALDPARRPPRPRSSSRSCSRATLGHVLFLFLTASVIAFTLNPLVRDLTRLQAPAGARRRDRLHDLRRRRDRARSSRIGSGRVRPGAHRRRPDRRVRHRGRRAAGQTGGRAGHRPSAGAGSTTTGSSRSRFEQQVNDWLDVAQRGRDLRLRAGRDLVRPGRRVLVIVLLLFSVDPDRGHLDLHAARHAAARGSRSTARFPPHGGLPLTQRIERALWGYVKGQVILSTVIGDERRRRHVDPRRRPGSSRVRSEYALLFGLWTAFVEVIPYIGPWLSAVPPAIYALFVDPPWGVVWVGAALRLHLPGRGAHRRAERDGERAAAAPAARHLRAARRRRALRDRRACSSRCPTMAGGRAIWEFFRERVELERWDDGEPPLPVEVEIEPPKPRVGQRRPTLAHWRYASRAVSFPSTRLRRLRRTDALRSLVRETTADLDDFVMPLFACPGEGVVNQVEGLPGIAQLSVDELVLEARGARRRSASARCSSSGSRRRRTRTARAPGTRTASSSARCGRCARRRPG